MEMIQTMEYLSHIECLRLNLIGRFEPPELEKELQAFPGYQQTRFLSWLPWKNAWEKAKEANIGLLLFHQAPNHKNCLPNKLFEYMAVGLPVIVSNFPLWKEIVEGNKCGLCVDPFKPKEISEAIEYLLNNPALLHEMGRNGQKAVLQKFNWQKEIKKLLALYS